MEPSERVQVRAALASLMKRARSEEAYLTLDELTELIAEPLDRVERTLLALRLEMYDEGTTAAARSQAAVAGNR